MHISYSRLCQVLPGMLAAIMQGPPKEMPGAVQDPMMVKGIQAGALAAVTAIASVAAADNNVPYEQVHKDFKLADFDCPPRDMTKVLSHYPKPSPPPLDALDPARVIALVGTIFAVSLESARDMKDELGEDELRHLFKATVSTASTLVRAFELEFGMTAEAAVAALQMTPKLAEIVMATHKANTSCQT